MSAIAIMVIGTYCFTLIYMQVRELPPGIDIEYMKKLLDDFKDIVLMVVTFYYSAKGFLKSQAAGKNGI